MSRFRALLSAGRRTIGAGATAPAGACPRSGGVNRRGLLGLFVAVPFALPAAVRAATALEPFPALGIGTELMGVDLRVVPLGTDDWSKWPSQILWRPSSKRGDPRR